MSGAAASSPKQTEETVNYETEADEVRALMEKHSTPDTCWVVVRGRVIDVSSFASKHPGGKSVLVERAGQNVTKVFESIKIHLSEHGAGLDMLAKLDIGAFEGEVEKLRAADRGTAL